MTNQCSVLPNESVVIRLYRCYNWVKFANKKPLYSWRYIMEFQNDMKNVHVQSVGKALLILDLLAAEKSEMSLTDISSATGWAKSTVHGLVSTLREYGYIEQSLFNGRYKLGIKLFEMGNAVKRSWDINAVAKPHLRRLNEKTGEMVQLAVEKEGEVLYLDKLDAHKDMRIVSDIGIRLPVHCSGLGKALLAYRPQSEVKRIVKEKGMRAMTERTITTLPKLFQELENVRKNGYSIDDQEIMEGLRCIGAPIFDSGNQVRYAISVSGFYYKMQGQHLDFIIESVKKTAETISYEMGYRKK